MQQDRTAQDRAAETGTHAHAGDPRNADILVSVNGELVPRAEAVVSVFDSGFILGDGVWEGLRVIDGGIAFLRDHLTRLYEGARAIDMDIGLAPAALADRLFDCLGANDMTDGVHIRLMVTRGVKSTPYQDPRMTITPATIVIIPEYKLPMPDLAQRGLSLFTSAIRRTGPDQQDQKLNSHSKLNCIQACIQAAKAGADEALMLDPRGFVATCNSTHFFIVRRGEVWTSGGMYCLGGITRGHVLRVCSDLGIPAFEKDFSLVDVYGADEAFVTGTFAGVTPVRQVDGRRIGHPLETYGTPDTDAGAMGPTTRRILEAYKASAKDGVVRRGEI
ncbi:MAG: aminotransferase class IV [Hyphomicrobiaceae bacterium]